MKAKDVAPSGADASERSPEEKKKDNDKKPKLEHARLRMRFAAVMMDGAAMSALFGFMLVVGLAIGNLEHSPALVRLAISWTYAIVLFGCGPAYLIWGLVCFEGTTPAKRLLGMKVVRLDGERVSFKRVFVREFVLKLWLSGFTGHVLLIASGLVALSHPQRLALHDRVTATRVVRRTPSRG